MSDIIEVKAGVEAENDKFAAEVRSLLKEHHVRLINLMASPGAGKTSLLEQTIVRLKNRYRIAVLEADVDADIDAKRIEARGAKALQIHTGGSCHMDASMTLTALKQLDLDSLDLVFLENVGNLVCPAEFDTGADLRVMILSVPEGDDKPLKYPLMFQVVDCVLVNKIDTDEIFDFNLQKLEQNILPLNQNAKVIPISAFTGSGIENWLVYLQEKLYTWSRS
ncbi:MAG: hydrogenase nickel incorporation protein HypB [Anaerolineaceae bacterium]|nr:hydrogenase nickel incorporation protein HypB [Anaerolineaceae bacterium]